MKYRVPLRGISIVFGFGAALVLAGCANSGTATSTGSGTGSSGGSGTQPSGATLTGGVQGGQEPIVGSNVYMYAAGTSGYGTGATSLLSGTGYVVTDKNGNFSITGNYNCPTPETEVYLVAEGGDAGGGENSKIVLLSALGACGSLDSSTPINMNEETTVASVYSLAQFMTPGSTAVGTSSTNVTGLVNAFKTATNLVDIYAGTVRSVTPAGNGAVPQTTINALANIMVACVNTNGDSSACTSLFSAATPPGGSAPADTLAATLDIALNPGNNVSEIFGLMPSSKTFSPSLSSAPNDWTLSLAYTGGGLNQGQLLAIDAQGDVWVPNSLDPGTISEFSPAGAALSGSAGFSGGGLSYPYQLAVDTNGNVWAANGGNSTVSEHSANGTPLSGSGYTAQGLKQPYAIAVDGSGNVFTANNNNSVTKLNSSGSLVSQFLNGGLDQPYAIAVDASQNVWVANYGASNSVSKFSNSGTSASVSGFTGGGINGAAGIAIDGSGDSWIANLNGASASELNSSGSPLSGSGYTTPADVSFVAVDGANTIWTANTDGSISHLAANGAALSPSTGYISAGATGEVGIAVDGSGNVWTTDNSVNSLFEYIGVASPAVTPLQAAVKNNQLGKRP